MSFLDICTSWLAPHECLGCGVEGPLLCTDCSKLLVKVVPSCFRCRSLSRYFLTCESCLQTSDLQSVRSVATYGGLAKDLIWKLKSSGAQVTAKQLAGWMVQVCREDLLVGAKSLYVVPVPTATSRARQRGYDQAKLLAREVSRQAYLPYLDCLIRAGQTHQVGASRAQRLGQLTNEAFRVKRSGRLLGATLLLVDDVVTTGATLEAAASVLKQQGASDIHAVVFAQA